MMYIKENFIPYPDKKIQEELTRNLDRVYRSQNNLRRIREKQEQNKFKGKQFLEQATKIGREIKQKVGVASTRHLFKGREESAEFTRDNSSRNNHISVSSEFYPKPEVRRKKRKRFKYHFKRGPRTETDEDESEESRELVIGPTEDFEDWEEDEIEERAQELLKDLKQKDRLIRANHNAKFDSHQYRKQDGSKYRRKVDFVVDTIRDKLNFIKNFT